MGREGFFEHEEWESRTEGGGCEGSDWRVKSFTLEITSPFSAVTRIHGTCYDTEKILKVESDREEKYMLEATKESEM